VLVHGKADIVNTSLNASNVLTKPCKCLGVLIHSKVNTVVIFFDFYIVYIIVVMGTGYHFGVFRFRARI